MNNRQAVNLIKDELRNEVLDKKRNAKLRITSEVNGEFRLNIEKLLQDVEFGDKSAIDALKEIVLLDAKAKNTLAFAKKKMGEKHRMVIHDNNVEVGEFLKEQYESEDWIKLNEQLYSTILKMKKEIPRQSEDSGNSLVVMESEDSEDEEDQNNEKPTKGKLFVEDPERLKQYLDELDRYTGLTRVKELIHQQVDLLNYNKALTRTGLTPAPISLHMVFTGNPGTGKTTIGRLIGKIYRAMGLLSSGHFKYVERADMVGKFLGHTEDKTKKILDDAMGGVLFIDEAYSLDDRDKAGDKGDFGNRVIELLLTAMENHRDDLVVIAAGYPRDMKIFIKSNPGLESRFSTYVEFDDYSSDELMLICRQMLEDRNFALTEEADKVLQQYFRYIFKNKGENFANGRTVRNLIEVMIRKIASRCVKSGRIDTMVQEELITMTIEDVEAAIKEKSPEYFESSGNGDDE